MPSTAWAHRIRVRLRSLFARRPGSPSPSAALHAARASAAGSLHHRAEVLRANYRLRRETPVRAAGGEPVALVAVEEQGRERAAFHHGTCPVNHRTAQAAAACRRGETPVATKK